MFFNESEYLLHDGVAGKSAIEAVDSFLASRSRTREDVLDADLVARHTAQDRAEVRDILAALDSRGAFESQRMVRCPNPDCRTLIPADRVEQSRADGDDEACAGPCGQDLAAVPDLEVVTAYKLVAQPVL